jgi:hypothetical protein
LIEPTSSFPKPLRRRVWERYFTMFAAKCIQFSNIRRQRAVIDRRVAWLAKRSVVFTHDNLRALLNCQQTRSTEPAPAAEPSRKASQTETIKPEPFKELLWKSDRELFKAYPVDRFHPRQGY